MHSFDEALQAAARGEGRGYDHLYRLTAGRIRAYVATRGVEDPDALTNETFVRAFRRIADFEGDERAFLAWLFTIARNLVIDGRRMASRRPQRSGTDAPDVRTAPSAETIGLGRLADARVERLLSELTPAQREVIVLRILADLSLAEVAQIVGRPITAVKRLQSRALQSLQRRILDEGVS